MGGHTEGPFLVLDRTTRMFLVQHSDVVERVNSDTVGSAPTPTVREDPRPQEGLEATFENLETNNREEDIWLVKGVSDHGESEDAVDVQF